MTETDSNPPTSVAEIIEANAELDNAILGQEYPEAFLNNTPPPLPAAPEPSSVADQLAALTELQRSVQGTIEASLELSGDAAASPEDSSDPVASLRASCTALASTLAQVDDAALGSTVETDAGAESLGSLLAQLTEQKRERAEVLRVTAATVKALGTLGAARPTGLA